MIEGINAIMGKFLNKDEMLKQVRAAFKQECEGKTNAEIIEAATKQINSLNANLNAAQTSVNIQQFMPQNTPFFKGVEQSELFRLQSELSKTTGKQLEVLTFIREYFQSVILDQSKI